MTTISAQVQSYTQMATIRKSILFDGVSVERIPNRTSKARFDKTLSLMRELITEGSVDPDIRMVAVKLTQSCPDRDTICEITKIFNFVKKNFRFVSDVVGYETLQRPSRMIVMINNGNGAGDCDDHQILIQSLLNSIGIDTDMVVGRDSLDREYHHVYGVAYYNNKGNGVYIDPSMKSPEVVIGWRHPAIIDERIVTF